MKFVVLIDNQDTASLNIASFLDKSLPIHCLKKKSIYSENIDKEIEADFYIFATKHQGKQGKMLSCHAPGNFNKAEYGGQEGKVCPTSARILKTFFQFLTKNTPKNWQATLEVTHHGPLINKPCLFIEIGSSEQDWKNQEAGKAIAKTIEESINQINNKDWSPAIGVGGRHYCYNFNKIQLNSKYALSHIISGNEVPITKSMLQEATNKTQEKVKTAIIDWKGLKGKDRQEVVQHATELGLKILRTSEIKKD